jgi:uncharacterized protein (TIGR03435 family)
MAFAPAGTREDDSSENRVDAMMKTQMGAIAVAIAIISPPIWARGQAPPRPTFDAFEVAAIKPASPEPGRWIRMQSVSRFEAHNHTVRTLVAAAYDLPPEAIAGGPGWVDSDHWDILAKAPGEVRPQPAEQMSMLRQLLSDRFKLAFHRESKQLSIFALRVAAGGPKLKASTVSPDANPAGPPLLAFVMSPMVIRLPARYATMAEFASLLQRSPLDRPVVDRTGLAGRYDFDLEFAPDESLWSGILPRPENSDKPSLLQAMQEELGLKLEATKGPVDALIIDRVERPSEN